MTRFLFSDYTRRRSLQPWVSLVQGNAFLRSKSYLAWTLTPRKYLANFLSFRQCNILPQIYHSPLPRGFTTGARVNRIQYNIGSTPPSPPLKKNYPQNTKFYYYNFFQSLKRTFRFDVLLALLYFVLVKCPPPPKEKKTLNSILSNFVFECPPPPLLAEPISLMLTYLKTHGQIHLVCL